MSATAMSTRHNLPTCEASTSSKGLVASTGKNVKDHHKKNNNTQYNWVDLRKEAIKELRNKWVKIKGEEYDHWKNYNGSPFYKLQKKAAYKRQEIAKKMGQNGQNDFGVKREKGKYYSTGLDKASDPLQYFRTLG